MYKDGNSVSIDLLHETECDELNGLEVKVDLKQQRDLYSFREAIKKQLPFFDNLFVIDEIDNLFADNINNLKIKEYDNFMVNSLDTTKNVSILLGKVKYPLRSVNLNKSYFSEVLKYPIALKLDIGDVEVTPNREEILYSSKSINKIEEVFDAAIEEINDMIEKTSVKDFTDFEEYRSALTGSYNLKLLGDSNVNILIPNSQTNLTYKGETYNSTMLNTTYKTIHNMNLIKNDYIYSDGRISYSQNWFGINRIKINFSNIYFADVSSLKKISKDYIRDTFESNSFFFKPISAKRFLFQFIRYLKIEDGIYRHNYGGTFKYSSKYVRLVLSEISHNFYNVQKFNDDSVPKKWIADVKAERKRQRALKKKKGYDPKKSVTLYKMRAAYSGGGLATDSCNLKLKDLSKRYKSLCIYAEKDHPKIEAFYNVFYSHVKIFKVASTKVKVLAKIDNFEYIDDFMEDINYKHIRNIGTAVYIKKTLPYLSDINYIQGIDKISKKLKELVHKLHSFMVNYLNNINIESDSVYKEKEKNIVLEIYDLCVEHNYFNEEVKGLLDENKTMLVNAQCLKFLSTQAGTYSSHRQIKEESVNICVDYILARKLFRPDFEAVKKLKEETIFNIKPQKTEKDENN